MKAKFFFSVALAIAMVTSVSASKVENNKFPGDKFPYPAEVSEWSCISPDVDPTAVEGESEASEVMPQFPGGKAELNKFLSKNLKYPVKAYDFNVQGTVVCRLTINEQGYVVSAWVVQSLSDECDQEALRVISKMPRWRAAKQNGEAVSFTYEMPISFKIQDDVYN